MKLDQKAIDTIDWEVSNRQQTPTEIADTSAFIRAHKAKMKGKLKSSASRSVRPLNQ